MTMSFVWIKILIIFKISYVESDWHILFSKNQGNFTVSFNKRTLPCKDVIKEFSLFFKAHDKLPLCNRGGIQVGEYKNTH